MKVGEIWEYCGAKDLNFKEISNFLSASFEEADSQVRILAIIKADSIEIITDGDMGNIKDIERDMDDFIEFEHVVSGAIGVLDRMDFIKLYRKVYE